MQVTEAALQVPSPRVGGRAMMVGRLYREVVPGLAWVFWHKASPSERGLVALANSYGGIDAAAVNYLMRLPGPGLIVVTQERAGAADATVRFDEFLEYAVFKEVGGRARLFLPDAYWHEDVFEPPRRFLKPLPLRPYLKDPRTDEAPPLGAPVRPKPKPPVSSAQAPLF